MSGSSSALIYDLLKITATNKLLALTSLAGFAVPPVVSEPYSRNIGKFNGVPLKYTEAELVDYLKDSGVISLRRQAFYYRENDGEVAAK